MGSQTSRVVDSWRQRRPRRRRRQTASSIPPCAVSEHNVQLQPATVIHTSPEQELSNHSNISLPLSNRRRPASIHVPWRTEVLFPTLAAALEALRATSEQHPHHPRSDTGNSERPNAMDRDGNYWSQPEVLRLDLMSGIEEQQTRSRRASLPTMNHAYEPSQPPARTGQQALALLETLSGSTPDNILTSNHTPGTCEQLTQLPNQSPSTDSVAPQESQKQTIWCAICTETFDPERNPSLISYTCTCCVSSYCSKCFKQACLKACVDFSLMPPRCCYPFSIPLIFKHLNPGESTFFKEKYEEWRTPNPRYCPVPTCSAFIPERFVQSAKDSKPTGNKRMDSPQRTEALHTEISCPKCEALICTNCRQLSHISQPCPESDVDEATLAALERWGYKRCPKCRNGVRRMHGCRHMQCLCGAQWCWWCQAGINDCDGDCDHPDSDEEQEELSEDEDDVDADTGPTTQTSDTAMSDTPLETISSNIVNEDESRPARRRRRSNLDARPDFYWNNQGIYFGSEPDENAPDDYWNCKHTFKPMTFEYKNAKDIEASTTLCTHCWKTVHPKFTFNTFFWENIGPESSETYPKNLLSVLKESEKKFYESQKSEDLESNLVYLLQIRELFEPVKKAIAKSNDSELCKALKSHFAHLKGDIHQIDQILRKFGVDGIESVKDDGGSGEEKTASIRHNLDTKGSKLTSLVDEILVQKAALGIAWNCQDCETVICHTCKELENKPSGREKY